jgi:AGCS family alanine or glycine:cation symporter
LLATLNGVLWHEYVLYAIVGTGLLFTIWSGFSQCRALTHWPNVICGVYDDPDDPGGNVFRAWNVGE